MCVKKGEIHTGGTTTDATNAESDLTRVAVPHRCYPLGHPEKPEGKNLEKKVNKQIHLEKTFQDKA